MAHFLLAKFRVVGDAIRAAHPGSADSHPMKEAYLRQRIESVRRGTLPRRDFIFELLKAGLTAPIAGHLLLSAGVAQTPKPAATARNRRGGGGDLKLLWWQGPTALNPHFANGMKDVDASRIFYEPLARWDQDANLVPVLAAEIPTMENGGVARDGRSVTWKLKPGVRWHDGKPFTSADVVFNWKYASDPAAATVTLASYMGMRVEALDALTVRIEFETPRAFWADPFVGSRGGMIIPEHLFAPYMGEKSREAPANLRPVGTGPYKFSAFTPGDMLRAVINEDYHQPNRPYFDRVELKGGGDAVSAARAVLQTGQYDFAENLQVEDEVLTRLEKAGKGRVVLTRGSYVEYIFINFSDPWKEVEGERSSPKSQHPILSEPAVREALSLSLDRASILKFIYGRTAEAAANFTENPERYRSKNNRVEFNLEKAGKLLDAAGWKPGSDGVRVRNGKKLKLLFQTSVNQPRQKTQAIFKQACRKSGIDLELKAVTPSVFFSSDHANPDVNTKFFSDLQLFAYSMSPDPWVAMRAFCSWEVAAKANKWAGLNLTRWRNDEFDAAYRAAERELDPVKRAALIIRMNDLVVQHRVVLPLVSRLLVSAESINLNVHISGWESTLDNLAEWSRGT